MSLLTDLWNDSAIGKSLNDTSNEVSKWAKIQISLLAVTSLTLIVIAFQGRRKK